jgi:trehalose 6-phosphate synthase
MSRLVVVSNRVALPKEVRAGGLASAMHSAMAKRGGLWFGWSGRVVEEAASTPQVERAGMLEYAVIDLAREDHEAFYLGLSNRTLWPLLHFRPGLLEFRRTDLEGYERVNRQFAAALAPLLREDDTIWVHDYHLIPLARELRRLGIGARIGFFLHIPLPPPELLITLPHHARIFEALADYDLVGLQTPADADALKAYFGRKPGATVSGDCVTTVEGRRFSCAAFPIGIDTDRIAEHAAVAATNGMTRGLQTSLQGRALAIGVDRLDYSKGLPEKFEAIGRFFDTHPERRRTLSTLQVAPLSRAEVTEYRELRARLERIAGAINGRHAEPDWAPIRYLNRSYNHATLTGYYRIAQIGIVTPLRDGMNLVAKEFVAAQPAEDPGVLILSRFAGAAIELPQALIVNPFDPDDTAEAIETALAMPLTERRARWQVMMDHLRRNDIVAWRDAFLNALSDHRRPAETLSRARPG